MIKPTYNRLASQLNKPLAAARFLHTAPALPYFTEKGLAPLYSPTALNRLYNQRLPQLLAKVDELSKHTEYETKSLKDIIVGTSLYPEHAALYNYASQAWNMSFFFTSLSDKMHEPSPDIRSEISSKFGSFEGFQEIFKQHSLGIFGNGWTWLVMDSESNLFIKNTYNAGSLFSMLPKTTPGLIAKETRRILNVANANLNGRPIPNKASETNEFPILGLNMWLDSYIDDFNYDREAYVDSFWKVVDWTNVYQKIKIDKYN
ncbi:hypothetical protein BB561_003044 [Smittium simulii]|uniref:Manganese/iron superoxide dismutase C-terminal domain-containing protein n=1 Tax=Smittium simulii TaxID=133385 RepID=A0A2T9YN84_9FUNG|nr:hypothetical protein BB561_003044 [Smittium simulii]